MRLISQYIFRTLLKSVLQITLILFALLILILFSAEFSDIGKGDYSFLHALFFVFMITPIELYKMFPIGCFFGALIGLGQISRTNELIVMKLSGISLWQFAKSILQVAVFFAILAFWVQ